MTTTRDITSPDETSPAQTYQVCEGRSIGAACRCPDCRRAADPLQGFSPDEIVIGSSGQTLAQAAASSPATRVRVSNRHAERIGWHMTALGRSWTVVESTGDHVEDTAVCETDATRADVVAAMEASVDVAGDACSAIEWPSPRHIGDGRETRCGDLMGPHDGVRLCGTCTTTSPDERTIPCGALLESTPAEELAAMAPADRAVAERVADLEIIEPAPGYVERAVNRAKREGVLPTP